MIRLLRQYRASPDPVLETFNIPEENGILFGMAYGYMVNTLRLTKPKLVVSLQKTRWFFSCKAAIKVEKS
jgi:hypothetical protein